MPAERVGGRSSPVKRARVSVQDRINRQTIKSVRRWACGHGGEAQNKGEARLGFPWGFRPKRIWRAMSSCVARPDSGNRNPVDEVRRGPSSCCKLTFLKMLKDSPRNWTVDPSRTLMLLNKENFTWNSSPAGSQCIPVSGQVKT
jgi:hypothetical protein